ncbi:MAG: DNA translocase FtsK 4TM domain-containing protein [Geothrix sp.]|uniref:FtsK/SpoIIIE family DNA translocase n=1 Tax=Geothrix sp. TaxID=1962974 RepID=UPI0017C03F6B|nr:DNA translocase FtsK 4TM domain-containing protein [Geothrix sp.]NWJ40920.1 DNA translocase FtsK 4TM domain-containing protein [Geothrix sp.]WIL21080.1 MAG: DNA translocase FtsK 4TM domain-containing protein [Geothrix sp.]
MQGIGRWMLRASLGFTALVLLLSLASYHPLDPHPFTQGAAVAAVQNLCGTVGATMAGLLQTLMGIGAWIVPPYLIWEAWPRDGRHWPGRLAWLGLALSFWTALGAFGNRTWAGLPEGGTLQLRWGGWLGSALWPVERRFLGPVGLPLLLAIVVLLCALVLAPALTRALGLLLTRWFGEKAWPWVRPMPAKGFQGFLTMVKRPFLRGRNPEQPDIDAGDAVALQALAQRQQDLEDQRESLLRAELETAEAKRKQPLIRAEDLLPPIQSMNLDAASTILEAQTLPVAGPVATGAEPTAAFRTKLLAAAPPPPKPRPTVARAQVVKDRFGREIVQPPLPLTEPTPSRPLPPLPPEPAHPSVTERETLPPRRLFDPPGQHAKVNLAMLEVIKEKIGQKLSEFKIKGVVTGMQPGPVVTVFEFQPDAGIPLSRILGMEEDLALALQAEAVRMDRIPGKNLVGIEVPNPKREIITFREVIDSPAFRDAGGLLHLALGKDIAGRPVVADLNKMPHLLIGGSTGSGKSVGVNAMICSCLVRAMPDEVKLILVDPKMVELGVYEDIPHLWAPVVTDMKEAGRVLKWVVAQMEDRYRRLALLSVRDLKSFNAKIAEAGGMMDLTDRTPNPRWPDRPAVLEHLPYVLVVIDELADLMMVARSEVEDSIARIAQKARAVGIHLILATQRPSVDVVTGVIKANLPSRLSYRVRTKIDSRTILDCSGGEQLLGAGDALYLPNGASHPKRIHAPFLSEEETLRLVTWLRERGRPDYNQALISAMETEEETALFDEAEMNGVDDIYQRALAVVRRERKASTSLLQRKLNLGYGRAARLIDRMEEEGIVGPDRGAGKPREVLVEAE